MARRTPEPSASTRDIAAALARRARQRSQGLSDTALMAYVADTVYLERRRFESQRSPPSPAEQDALARAAHALRTSRNDLENAVLALTHLYALEIHNHFDARTYNVATKILPTALGRLLTAADRKAKVRPFDPSRRVLVSGPLDQLVRLSEKATLILAPTHLSNLDSPLIGFALHAAGLPPFIYGAGLNLFENPAMGFLMSRLGAYTVDRRKKHAIYKDSLKDYSTEMMARGRHSIFFPGGTRARSGALERQLKKGLLGTGLSAWRESVEAGETRDVFVVPCTMSATLVLEAETLIEDHLAEAGRSRYIISDDEFSQPLTVATFTSRVLELDASVHVRFGRPMDVVGNPVDAEGVSLGPHAETLDRLGYIRTKQGTVVDDPQRDAVYTQRLADEIARAFRRDNTALATHLAAHTAWTLLRKHNPGLDTYRLVLLDPHECAFDVSEYMAHLARARDRVAELAAKGELQQALPQSPQDTLSEALDRFGRYHRRRALEREGDRIRMDPRLCLYYGNRLAGYGLEEERPT